MYAYQDRVPVLGGLGALQTGALPQGSTVLVPKGTVVTVIDPRYPTKPKTAPLSNDMSLVLIGDAAVEGDVVGRDLVSVGGEATLAYETGMLLPDPTVEGAAAASGRQVNVPAGTKVTIQRLPAALTQPPPQPTEPTSQADCPAGTTFRPGVYHDCPPGFECQASIPASCVPGGGGVVPASAAVPWYKRGSTYVIGGGILLVVIVAAAAMRKR